LLLISAGIACVHGSEWQRVDAGALPAKDLLLGMALAGAALVCWTWYPIRNAAWVQAHPQVGSGTWATAQGLATLPLAAVGMTAYMLLTGAWAGDAPWGPRPWTYAGLMLAIGLLASWLGTLCWNRASALLPTSLTGQLIVFETLAALIYGFIHRGSWPGFWIWTAMALMVAGVVLAARVFARPADQ
jgi:drug/metabolite transporter (DMT)-like permease